MKLKKIVWFYLMLLIAAFNINLSSIEAQAEECDIINTELINNAERVFSYHEFRNDIGIHYDFAEDKDNKKIIIKRDENDYPIVRFSLFEKTNIKPGSVVKTYNGKDLSNLKDEEINKLHKTSGKVELQLINNKVIELNSNPYHLNDFKLSNFIIKSVHNIDTAKGILEISLDSHITSNRNDLYNIVKKVENYEEYLVVGYSNICSKLKNEIPWPIKHVEFNEYKYDEDVREGLKNKGVLVNSVFDLSYDQPNLRSIRTEKGIFYFRQYFDFKKFPFDKQKLIITIKTDLGNYSNENNLNYKDEGSVTFVTPEIGVFLELKKFKEKNYLKKFNWDVTGVSIKSREIEDDNYFDIWTSKIIKRSINVLDIEIEIERYVKHYIYKIILPVFLILCVAWYVLWIPTRKYETRLNTSIIALLALIAYNFVFQDDIPKLNYLTDLDWYILLSYVFCCIPVFISIGSSKLGTKNQKVIIKINKLIRKWGIAVYILITFTIFKLI